jgi:hypothetical protein
MKVEAHSMPVLMIALLALAAFGLIGILLAAAVLSEPRKAQVPGRPEPGKRSVGDRVA